MGISQSAAKERNGPGILDRLLAVRWSTHRGRLLALFGILGIILVAPVWTVEYPPLVDFPNHLASTFVLSHLHDSRFHFSRFYASNWNLGPYLAMDLILVGLQKLLPAMLAGRIFLTLCLLVVPPAVWLFLKEANPGEERLAFWSLLLCSNMFFFLYGLLDLQLSFALCFVVLGFWLRYLKKPGAALWWVLLSLATALYFTHIVGFCVAGLVVSVYLISARRSLREFLLSWLLFLPGSLLYLHWKAAQAGSWPAVYQPLSRKIGDLTAIMLGYSHALDFLTLLAILGCIFLACADNPELRWNRPWLVVLGCLFAVFLALPSNYGPGTMVARRILPFIFVVALAGAKVGRRGLYLVPIALGLFAVRTGNVEMNFTSIQPHLETLARSFTAIPENARILPMVHRQSEAGTPEDDFWAYGIIKRGWFSPYLFHDKGVQPLGVKLGTYTLGRYAAFVTLARPVKWSRIQSDYDYIWAYGASKYSRQMAGIGNLVLESDGLQIYQLTKSPIKRHQKARGELPMRQQKVTPGPREERAPTGEFSARD